MFMVQVWVSGFRVPGFRVNDLGCRNSDFGFAGF